MKKKDLLLKLKKLSEMGVGGERINAQKMLDNLLAESNLSISDLESDSISDFPISIKKFFNSSNLLCQIVYMVLGDEEGTGLFREGKRYLVRCSSSSFLEIKALYQFYSFHFLNDLKVFYKAFVYSNILFPSSSKVKGSSSKLPSDDDIKALNLSCSLEKHNFLIGIEHKV